MYADGADDADFGLREDLRSFKNFVSLADV
jgi:hypothetical protein